MQNNEVVAINLWMKDNPGKSPSKWGGVALDKQQRYRELAEKIALSKGGES